MRLAVYNSGARLKRSGIFYALALACVSCAKPPTQAEAVPHDSTSDAWYRADTAQLESLSRSANDAYGRGKPDSAATFIEQGEAVAKRLLAVPRPSLPALEAASDLDDLYGRMLLHNRHYGWARLQFQKNLARWKHWEPKTADTERRLRAAQAAIDDCDRKIDSGKP